MRTRVVAVVLIALVAVAVAAAWFLGHRRSPGLGKAVPPRASRSVQAPVPPLPDLRLEVDAADRAELFQGTPLVLTVRIGNPRAVNAAARNEANARYLDFINQSVTRGDMSAAVAEPMRQAARETRPVQSIRVGTSERAWDNFIHFERRRAGGAPERLNWPLTLVDAPASKELTLDATSHEQLDYALAPQAAAQIVPDTYELVAVFEVPSGSALPAGHWRGRVASQPVTVTITAAPAQPWPADRASQDLRRAEFFATTREWSHAREAAARVLEINPKEIRAHMIVGEAKEAQGDLHGAMTAFVSAESLFYERYPDSYESPEYLILKIASIDERLGSPR